MIGRLDTDVDSLQCIHWRCREQSHNKGKCTLAEHHFCRFDFSVLVVNWLVVVVDFCRLDLEEWKAQFMRRLESEDPKLDLC